MSRRRSVARSIHPGIIFRIAIFDAPRPHAFLSDRGFIYEGIVNHNLRYGGKLPAASISTVSAGPKAAQAMTKPAASVAAVRLMCVSPTRRIYWWSTGGSDICTEAAAMNRSPNFRAFSYIERRSRGSVY